LVRAVSIRTGTLAISPYVFVKPPYDAAKDFTYVARMAQLNTVLWVRKDSPFASVKDLVAFARANPGKLNYASTGPGAVSHLGGVLLGLRSGTSSVHVPYKSTAASSTAVLSGEADFGFESLATALMDPGATLVLLTVEPRPGEIEKRLVTEVEAQRVLAGGVEIKDRQTIKESGSPGLFSGAAARGMDVLVQRTASDRSELAGARF
jgi:tripartite-type tricarboxylate transporter receptor subunit TctC